MSVSAVTAVLVRPNICNRCALFTLVTIAMDKKERGRKTRTSSNCSAVSWMELGSSCQLPNFSLLTPAPGVYPQSHTLNPSPTAGQDAATFPGPGPLAAEPEAPGGGSPGSEPPREGRGGGGAAEGANQRARLWPGRDWRALGPPTSAACPGPLSHCIP